MNYNGLDDKDEFKAYSTLDDIVADLDAKIQQHRRNMDRLHNESRRLIRLTLMFAGLSFVSIIARLFIHH